LRETKHKRDTKENDNHQAEKKKKHERNRQMNKHKTKAKTNYMHCARQNTIQGEEEEKKAQN